MIDGEKSMDDGIVCPNPRCGADKPGDFRKRGSYENLTGEVDRLGCRVCGLVFSPRTTEGDIAEWNGQADQDLRDAVFARDAEWVGSALTGLASRDRLTQNGIPLLMEICSGEGADPAADAAVMRLLLEGGANPDARDHFMENAALHTCAWNGRLDLAAILLDGKADPNARNLGERTPLHMAAALPPEKGHAEDAIRLLIGAGADPSAVDCDGKTAIELALAAGNDSLAGLLGKSP